MRKLLFDVCVNRRDTWPAFVSVRPGDFVSDHIAATSPDTAVLELARTLDRILVTEDFDFGDLIFRDRLPPPPGIILVAGDSIPIATRSLRLRSVARDAIETADGGFVIVGPNLTRRRPLPTA